MDILGYVLDIVGICFGYAWNMFGIVLGYVWDMLGIFFYMLGIAFGYLC